MERKHQIIESLLQKPSKKPDFSSFKGSDVLKRAQEFMPKFIQTTDRLLTDPELLKEHQMDIQVFDKDEEQHIEENQMSQQQLNLITMDIGVGLFDVMNENYNEKDFKPSSTEPIVKIQGMDQKFIEGAQEDESSSDSDDSDLYLEFNSDSEQEVASSTTKSTTQQQKRPLIMDITPAEENQKKTLKVNNKKRKRQRKH